MPRARLRPGSRLAVGLAAAIGIAAAACGGSGSTSTVTSPSSVPKCSVSIDAGAASVPAEGGSGQIAVTTARECAWTAETQGAWLSIKSGASGQGDGVVEYVAVSNPDPVTRRAAIVLNSARADITQAAGTCSISLGASSAAFPPEGGSGRVDVRASSALCAWTSSASESWITIRSGASGTGNGSVAFEIAPTTGPPRTGTLTIAGQRFEVTESQGCAFSIAPASFAAPSAGASGSVTVTTAAGCPWNAGSNVDWISVTSASSGSGPGAAAFVVAPTTGVSRTGTLVVAGQTLTVTQSQGCQYDVGPAAHAVAAAGGAGLVTIATASGCGWTAASNVPWILIDGATSGTGPASVRFAAQPTSGPVRTGTLTVAGRTITVTQSQGCAYTVTPETASVAAAGGSVRIAVAAGAGCAWTAASAVSWITIVLGASGSGDGAAQLTIAATSGPSRSGTVTVAGRTVTVTQGDGCSVALSAASASAPAGGGQGSFDVQAASGCTWSATTGASWLSIASGQSGSGSGSVRYTAAANSGAARTGTIAVGGQTFTVNQAGGCAATLSAPSVNLPAGGGSGSVNIATDATCSWSSSSDASWLTITSGQSGSGNGAVQFTGAANTGPARSGTLTIAGRPFTVNQESGCSLAATPETIAAASSGGPARIDVATPSDCAWSASSTVPWIAITAGAGGSGNGSVEIAIGANSGPDRSGGVRIGTQTVTVNQSSGCTFTLGATSQSVPDTGGPGSVTVTTSDGCAWTAVSQAPWIAVTSGGSGSGSGTVQFAVEPRSSGDPRTGTITIAGQTFTVNQN